MMFTGIIGALMNILKVTGLLRRARNDEKTPDNLLHPAGRRAQQDLTNEYFCHHQLAVSDH